MKVLRRAFDDPYPEVKSNAARLACALAPICVSYQPLSSLSSFAVTASPGQFPGRGGSNTATSPSSGGATSPLSYAEEIIVLAGKNLDDEKAGVAAAWAEAMARCI
ncbi:MAG: hypothetical protein ACREBR_00745 [bacterium]